MKFERVYEISGTLDDFVSKLERPSEDQIKLLNEINLHITDKVYLKKFDFNRELFDERFGPGGWRRYDASRGNLKRIAYVDGGLIGNAGDSLITRMAADEQFIAEMKIKLSYDGEVISFEIEDNGTGINPEVEPLIFSELIDSSKKDSKLRNAYIGKLGEHMLLAKERIKKCGGLIHFKNKGHNQGARFWYEVPANKLK
jgi:signal transduction histidine kinase